MPFGHEDLEGISNVQDAGAVSLLHDQGSVVLFASAEENVFFEVDVCLCELGLWVLYPFIVYVYSAALEVFFRILTRCG